MSMSVMGPEKVQWNPDTLALYVRHDLPENGGSTV